jgi:hypothetical protein
MRTGLDRIAGALTELSVRDLEALRKAVERAPQVVPGLLAWLEHASRWELDWREGRDYRLAAPMDAIPPEEVAPSLNALVSLIESFASGRGASEVRTEAILELFDATQAMLTD